METVIQQHSRFLSIPLLAVALIATAPLVLESDGPFHQWTGLDFSYLVVPLVLFGALALASRLALSMQWTTLGPRLVWDVQIAGRQQRIQILPVGQKLFLGLGYVVVVYGLLAAVPLLPATLSAHPDLRDLTGAEPYLGAFDSLAQLAVFLLVPFVIAQALTQVWPRVADIVVFPQSRLLVFAVAYVVLADGGVFSTALELTGSHILIALACALGVSYLSSMLQITIEQPLPQRSARVARWALVLTETAWMAASLLSIVALASAVETALGQRYADDAEAFSTYLALFDSLVLWSLAVGIPFALMRAARTRWPLPSRILGLPITHMIMLAAAYVLFSGNGILVTAFQFPVQQLMVVLTFGIALSYLATVLRNVSSMPFTGRLEAWTPPMCRLVVAVIPPVVAAMVAWLCLNHFPVANARLLDYEWTREFGQTYLPYLANLFDGRFAIAGLVLAAGLALNLPRALQVYGVRYLPLFSAIGYSAAACLAWIAGSSLSPLGHGYPLIGSIVAVGLFSLAVAQLSSYITNASNPTVARVGSWLYESKARGFILGASIAFYGLLVRPVVYDVLWFGALYEYVAVLALMLFALLRIGNSLRRDADAPNAPPLEWPNWAYHEQFLETKIDPRSELMTHFQHQYLEYGNWKPLWTYLMGLLYRSEAPLESVRDVSRPLCNSASSSAYWFMPGKRQRTRARREAALKLSLGATEQALGVPPVPLSPVEEGSVRQASALYVESGDEPETLAATIMAAHYLEGEDVELVAERCFPLVSGGEVSLRWFHPPWMRSRIRDTDKSRRLQFVDEAIASLFSDTPQQINSSMAAMV